MIDEVEEERRLEREEAKKLAKLKKQLTKGLECSDLLKCVN